MSILPATPKPSILIFAEKVGFGINDRPRASGRPHTITFLSGASRSHGREFGAVCDAVREVS